MIERLPEDGEKNPIHHSITPLRLGVRDAVESNGNLRETDVSPLFNALGIDQRVKVHMNDATYDVNPHEPKNNWLYPAVKAFQKLQSELHADGRFVGTFATVGTGPGIDAIAAQSVFSPRHLVLSDLHPDVIGLADHNVRMNAPEQAIYEVLQGSFCEPLRNGKIRPDVLYANLPNIPLNTTNAVFEGMNSSTYIPKELIASVPQRYNAYLLGTQYAFLRDAHDVLSDDGSLLLNIGGRVPTDLVAEMCDECGYESQDYYTMFKCQTEAPDVLSGYSAAEKENDVEFDFYYFKDASNALTTRDTGDMSAEELKEMLSPFRVTATEGLRCLELGVRVGHVVELVRGKKKKK